MRNWFAVFRSHGPAWDKTKPMRSQAGWDEHANFMDQLTAEGKIVLGGPFGEKGALLIFDAANEEEIHALLSKDNWSDMGLLETQSVERWTILLQAPENGA